MASVDNRIVRMEFDNAAFERKLETTIASLGKLEKALQLEGAKKGLADVSAEAGKMHFGHIGSALEDVSGKFLALATVGITALSNIVSAAMNAGIQIAKGLTSPIKEGFQEYETNLNSIQTILANTAAKGTSMDQVTGALDKLNQYSDKTIYNFGQMARNIGTFTAAGVDLDQSVNAIKGIANLSAMSGSTSEQASAAMYQMSQAMASGSLKAQDWISVVNSGIGGQVFQSSLYESAKALGTLKDVPMDQSFDQWKESGGNFRDAMAEGVFTSEVLGITLEGFTGDLTDAELAAKGFTDAQIAAIQSTAKVAQGAATEVKTFTQLMGTVKESVATGWADSMKIIIGDFGEAKHTWTALNTGISNFVKRNADARNELLKGWDALGGRAQLIEGFHSAISNIATILGTVKDAFREVFPAMTAERLFALTETFVRLAKALQPTGETLEKVKSIFRGFFSVLEIGWTILKEGIGFVLNLFKALSGAGTGNFLTFAAKIGDFFTALNEKLISGGAITAFFDKLTDAIGKIIPAIDTVTDKIAGFFKSLMPKGGGGGTDETADSVGRLEQRFQGLKDLFGKLGDVGQPFIDAMHKILSVLDTVWDKLTEIGGNIKKKLEEAFGPGTFEGSLDLINTGLLAGITTLIYKFFKEGFKFDIGDGLFSKIGKSFEELTGVLTAMQTSIKADALLKIAGAIAMLTASVVVLSLIDSEALQKALIAMAVGFGQLMAAFAILNKISTGPKAALSFDMIAIGMGIMSTSILVLAGAAKVLADLDWEELARGLTGVAALMAIVVIATKNMGDPKEMVLTASGMLILSFALLGLSKVVQSFADMSWGEMLQGFLGVALGLTMITIGMRAMPDNMERIGLGLLGVAKAMDMMVGVISAFAALSILDTAEGLLGLSITMQILATGLKEMPKDLPTTALGLLLVSIALLAIQKVVESFGGMSIFEIAKGLITMSISLSILAGALEAMTGTLAGAAALGLAAISLLILSKAIQEFADIGLGDLVVGLLGIVGVLLALAGAALLIQPALPAMLLLGGALALIGVGFALFGIGAQAVAHAFEIMAKSGKEGSEGLIASLEAIGRALPTLFKGFALGLIEMIATFLELAPTLIAGIVKLLGALMDGLATLIPKGIEIMRQVITGMISLIVSMYGAIIQAGLNLLIAFLTGLKEAIPQIVTLVIEIIAGFINAIASNLGQIIAAGVNLLLAFIQGIIDNLPRIVEAVGTLITTLITELGNLQNRIIDAGFELLKNFIKGIADNLIELAAAATDVVVRFCTEITNNVDKVVTAGGDMIIKLIQGFTNKASEVVDAGLKAVVKFCEGLAKDTIEFVNAAADILTNFLEALAASIRVHGPELRDAGIDVVAAIISGMTFGLSDKVKSVADGAVNLAKSAVNAAKGWLGISSPSKVFMQIGGQMAQGLAIGLDRDISAEQSAIGLVQRTTAAFEESFAAITASLGDMTELNPVITPILDLTRLASDAQLIGDYIQTSQKLSPEYSYAQARTIATSANAQQSEEIQAPAGAGEVTFNQTINSPTQLSATEIYKQTRNQITMAKQELSIP